MKKYYGGGSVLRDKMLAACKATYFQSWERRMLELKAVSKEAHDSLIENHDPILWAKSHFTEYSKCDMIMNNISEAFNGRILEARDLPIISMFEWIRVYLMTRFAKNMMLVEKYKGKSKICPKARKRFDKEVLESGKWTAIWAANLKFEVQCFPRQFAVDLEQRSCACRFWGLTGIPCRHAVAAIFSSRGDPQDYVDKYYRVDTYEEVYGQIINPVNGEQLWQPTGLPPVLPPYCRTRIGRPKKARRRERDEQPRPSKLRRQGTSIHCSRCGMYGHNMKRCQNLVCPTTDAATSGRGTGRGRGRSGASGAVGGASGAIGGAYIVGSAGSGASGGARSGARSVGASTKTLGLRAKLAIKKGLSHLQRAVEQPYPSQEPRNSNN